MEESSRHQKQLAWELEMKNLGALNYFLEIKVTLLKEGIFLSPKKYTLDLLSEIGLLEWKPTDTPIVQTTYFENTPTRCQQTRRGTKN